MKTEFLIAALTAALLTPISFGQGNYGGYSQPQSQPPPASGDRAKQATTTTTKKIMPVGVKGYLEEQMANSRDKKFHVALNGKDVALTPVKFLPEAKLGGNKSAAAVEMKGADGKTYDINFVLANNQVTGASIG